MKSITNAYPQYHIRNEQWERRPIHWSVVAPGVFLGVAPHFRLACSAHHDVAVLLWVALRAARTERGGHAMGTERGGSGSGAGMGTGAGRELL